LKCDRYYKSEVSRCTRRDYIILVVTLNNSNNPVKIIGCLRTYIIELVCCENNRAEIVEV